MIPRHTIPGGMRALLVAFVAIPAISAQAQSDQPLDPAAPFAAPAPGAEAGMPDPDPGPPQPDGTAGTHVPQAAPTPPGLTTSPSAKAPAAPNPPAAANAPAAEAPKILGRPFPTPVQPPPPAAQPEVHITVVPPSEPRVGRNRLRGDAAGGGDMGHEAGDGDGQGE